tara:strand:- start:3303 stop:3455 length:153 start_codon:yes stop_codon:yes gene_type:complete
MTVDFEKFMTFRKWYFATNAFVRSSFNSANTLWGYHHLFSPRKYCLWLAA